MAIAIVTCGIRIRPILKGREYPEVIAEFVNDVADPDIRGITPVLFRTQDRGVIAATVSSRGQTRPCGFPEFS